MFVVVDFVREMPVKKACKFGQYGSTYERLLILFSLRLLDIRTNSSATTCFDKWLHERQ